MSVTGKPLPSAAEFPRSLHSATPIRGQTSRFCHAYTIPFLPPLSSPTPSHRFVTSSPESRVPIPQSRHHHHPPIYPITPSLPLSLAHFPPPHPPLEKPSSDSQFLISDSRLHDSRFIIILDSRFVTVQRTVYGYHKGTFRE